MKRTLISFGQEKLNEVHPRVMLLLIEEMLDQNLGHADIRHVIADSVDELNAACIIIFRAVKGELQMGSNETQLMQFTCKYAKDFSCSNSHLKQM